MKEWIQLSSFSTSHWIEETVRLQPKTNDIWYVQVWTELLKGLKAELLKASVFTLYALDIHNIHISHNYWDYIRRKRIVFPRLSEALDYR